ncbi:hypothetical protein [Butyrivibrio sp. INlla14]|uniref:hypothetical protein n=1 Tax=Butyrivibrio sp. INlla14 TaxID=1520808 RepID=UPI0008768E69|nr:hypothetical protein [Butyrivibrio sp. INlla14]SCX96757.1 hypothetical protein SAMN02910371_00568 [Butyrivibrio sp. INlla14]
MNVNGNGITSSYNSFVQSVNPKKNDYTMTSSMPYAASEATTTFSSTLMSKMKESKAVDENNVLETDNSFEKMWTSRYPGAKYHVMDASKISQGVWERNDFPFEKFFEDNVDESILKWQPSGKDPAMADGSVQRRLNSTLGQKSIIVPPELEEKMKNDPALAQRVMDKVADFITYHPTRPGRICSYLISLDENGDIAHFRVTGGGGNISGPTKEEQRRFEEEQEEKRKRLLEKRALEKKWQQEAIDARRAYHDFLNGQAILKSNTPTEYKDAVPIPLDAQISTVLSAYEARLL